jgi:hypothetical protein
MKKLRFPLATLVVVLVAYGVGLRAPAQTTATQTNDGAEIRALHQRYITAFNNKDVATIMSSYLPGAVAARRKAPRARRPGALTPPRAGLRQPHSTRQEARPSCVAAGTSTKRPVVTS